MRSDETIPTALLTPPFSRSVSTHANFEGGHILGRWDRAFSGASDLTVQAFYDQARRDGLTLGERIDTVDVEVTHSYQIKEANRLVWGVGYRSVFDRLRSSDIVQFSRGRRQTHVFNAFVQDELSLAGNRLHVTFGSKFERNTYMGLEIQPNARALLRITPTQSVWGAASRAVQIPNRSNRDIRIAVAAFPNSPLCQ